MKMNRIKTSEANKSVVYNLTRNKYQFRDDRTIAQIAIAYSLQLNKKFTVEDFGKVDNKGKEYPESILGEINRKSNDAIYHAVFNQHYGRRLSDDEFSKLLKLHLDYGLEIFDREILKTNKGKNAHIDFLLSIINNSLTLLSSLPKFSPTFDQKELAAFSGLLDIQLGQQVNSGEMISIKLNDVNQFDSQHIALAGMTRSGKTQLVKDILFQLSYKSEYQLKFIFLDYKGEGKSENLKDFLDSTRCEFIDIQSNPFKFNPLSYINMTNERARDYNIRSFRDTVASIDKRIGVKQKNNLEQALRNCFHRAVRSGAYPSIQDVNDELSQIYELGGLNPDTLTSILSELAGGIFDPNTTATDKLFEKSIYLNLPPTLPESVRQAAVFLILNYLLAEYISYNDVKISENRIKPIRYVIVIDEAHVYLKSKNMVEVLENLLRMIGSKGVIVILLSQGIEEYRQKSFDFTSQIKIPILLNIQNKDLKLAKSFLGTPRSEHVLQKALNDLEGGKGVINFKEPQLIEVNQFWKTIKKP